MRIERIAAGDGARCDVGVDPLERAGAVYRRPVSMSKSGTTTGSGRGNRYRAQPSSTASSIAPANELNVPPGRAFDDREVQAGRDDPVGRAVSRAVRHNAIRC
jgi:hypothetical protein